MLTIKLLFDQIPYIFWSYSESASNTLKKVMFFDKIDRESGEIYSSAGCLKTYFRLAFFEYAVFAKWGRYSAH